MKIKQALDWNGICGTISGELAYIGYNADLHKMFQNIGRMVTELSKLEVEARRLQKFSYLDSKVEEINNAIDHLDKLILIAKLMK
jgi:predicted nuclease with TOPRIM domain